MRKVDFEKIEKDISDILRNMSVNDWLELAAISNLVGGISFQPTEDQTIDNQQPKEPKKDSVVEKILSSINQQLEEISQSDPTFYESLNITANDRVRLRNPTDMSSDDWQKLKEVREKMDLYHPSKKEEDPDAKENEKQIEKERKKHITKRFNVREAWLPLDTQKE
jgi:hypothetical protein